MTRGQAQAVQRAISRTVPRIGVKESEVPECGFLDAQFCHSIPTC